MPKAALGLIGFGVFMFAVATGQAIPNLQSSIINFVSLGEGTQLMYQLAVLILGFGGSIWVMSQ